MILNTLNLDQNTNVTDKVRSGVKRSLASVRDAFAFPAYGLAA